MKGYDFLLLTTNLLFELSYVFFKGIDLFWLILWNYIQLLDNCLNFMLNFNFILLYFLLILSEQLLEHLDFSVESSNLFLMLSLTISILPLKRLQFSSQWLNLHLHKSILLGCLNEIFRCTFQALTDVRDAACVTSVIVVSVMRSVVARLYEHLGNLRLYVQKFCPQTRNHFRLPSGYGWVFSVGRLATNPRTWSHLRKLLDVRWPRSFSTTRNCLKALNSYLCLISWAKCWCGSPPTHLWCRRLFEVLLAVHNILLLNRLCACLWTVINPRLI